MLRDLPRRTWPWQASSTLRRPQFKLSTCKRPVRITRCSHPSTTASQLFWPHLSQLISPGTGWSEPKTSSPEDLEVPLVLPGRVRPPRNADQLVQANRMRMADQVVREDLEVPVDRTRLPLKADRVVQGNRVDMAGQVVREVVVQGNRMGLAGQVVPVFREDLEVQVDRKDLAGRAGLSKQGPLVVPAKVASTGSRRNARRILTCLSANSSRAWVRAC